jgi:hypothetical protein
MMGIALEQTIVPDQINLAKKFDITNFKLRGSWFCKIARDGHHQ